MEATLLALKTPKGHEEIRSRAHGLSQKLRTLLMDVLAVMMDGAIADADRQSAFDDAMKLAEDYIARRKAEGWKCT